LDADGASSATAALRLRRDKSVHNRRPGARYARRAALFHSANVDAPSQIEVVPLLEDAVGGQRQGYLMLFAAVACVSRLHQRRSDLPLSNRVVRHFPRV
jgi:hypothetical protein